MPWNWHGTFAPLVQILMLRVTSNIIKHAQGLQDRRLLNCMVASHMVSRDHKTPFPVHDTTTHVLLIDLVKIAGYGIEAAGIKACQHAAPVNHKTSLCVHVMLST